MILTNQARSGVKDQISGNKVKKTKYEDVCDNHNCQGGRGLLVPPRQSTTVTHKMCRKTTAYARKGIDKEKTHFKSKCVNGRLVVGSKGFWVFLDEWRP